MSLQQDGVHLLSRAGSGCRQPDRRHRHSLFGGHEVVTVGVALDGGHVPTGMERQTIVQGILIFRISWAWIWMSDACLEAAQRLVDHHSGIGQAKRLPLERHRQQEGPMEQACPMQTVLTSGLMNCMVS